MQGGFIDAHKGGCIIDEIQHLPELTSHIQVAVDRYNAAREPSIGFFRDSGGHEIDFVIDNSWCGSFRASFVA